MPSGDLVDRSRRAALDAPPPTPTQRRAPKSALSSLAGRRSSPSATPSAASDASSDDDDDVNTPDGNENDTDINATSDHDTSITASAFRELAMAEAHLKNLYALLPGVGSVTQDLVTLLRQIVPQNAAAAESGSPLGLPSNLAGAGAPPQSPGTSPMSGLGMLAGGAPAGAGMGAPGPAPGAGGGPGMGM